MGEPTYLCNKCGRGYLESSLKWKTELDGNKYPYCAECYIKINSLRRIEELHVFAKGLIEKWEVDAPHSSEYLKGYISAMEIVLALLKS
jgi:hypothetical protein